MGCKYRYRFATQTGSSNIASQEQGKMAAPAYSAPTQMDGGQRNFTLDEPVTETIVSYFVFPLVTMMNWMICLLHHQR